MLNSMIYRIEGDRSMDKVTLNVKNFVQSRGINIQNMSEITGIPVSVLYDSLSDNQRDRNLRADEFLLICAFLNLNPYIFADKEEVEKFKFGYSYQG